jgi:hypothetical protein
MKIGLVVALLAASAQAVAVPIEQQAQAPQYDEPNEPVAPWGIPDLLSAGYSAIQYIQKVFGEVSAEYKKGTPVAKIVDQVIPQIFPEAKLLKRTPIVNEKTIRQGAIKARSQFGPYRLVGKNVSCRYGIQERC